MATIHSFKPIYQSDARVLILGSIPGKVSLLEQQYYAHGRNAFWKIMATLLSFDLASSYEERVLALKNNAIALWDVLAMCTRESSLDSDIVESTIVANDFNHLLDQLPELTHIYFNGAKAQQSFKRHVVPMLKQQYQEIDSTRLPSTSPAHAALSFEGKLAQWKIIKGC